MPLSRIMRVLIFSFFIFSSSLFAKDVSLPKEDVYITPLQVIQLFDEQIQHDIKTLPDLVDRENKVGVCIEEYIKKQSKSYSKMVQSNLYDLLHNFDRVVSKVSGKKVSPDNMSYEDKVEALAIVQCEAYYMMGVLR